jgi:hypothetical protein
VKGAGWEWREHVGRFIVSEMPSSGAESCSYGVQKHVESCNISRESGIAVSRAYRKHVVR